MTWARIEELYPSLRAPLTDSLSRARQAAESESFEQLAELPESESKILVPQLRSLATQLLACVEEDKRALAKLWTQRLVRIGLLLALAAAVAIGLQVKISRSEAARDIAKDKPWRASSASPGATSCTSPKQECDESVEFFFHTNEELKPWLEIDLGTPQSFSALRVENRKDCCTDRAFPLSIEISSDQQTWTKIARRDTAFSSWLAKFPAVTARYVRVRLEKYEALHLARVRVLP